MSPDLLNALLALVTAVALALALALAWQRRRAGRRSRARNRRAQAGEADAIALLEEQGYEILEEQATRSWTVWLDDEAHEATARADFIVGRDGLVYVAEVKTGARAPDPLYPPTRRQLLEYWFVFEPDGLLLVDVEAGDIIAVHFPGVGDPISAG